MKLVALMRARNEAWVLRYSAAAALQWVDDLVVMVHAPTDATPLIVSELADAHPGRVHPMTDLRSDWHEMSQLNDMLANARAMDATHVAIVDADEVLSAHLVPEIRHIVELLDLGEMLCLPWHNCWRSLDVYRDDDAKHGRQRLPLVFRDQPDLRWPKAEQFNHRAPIGLEERMNWPAFRDDGGVMHLQRANWRRAVARQDLYRMREILNWPGRESVERVDQRYASALDERAAVLKNVPIEWWAHELDRGLIDLAFEPWEAAETLRLLAEHGRERFAGLRLSCL